MSCLRPGVLLGLAAAFWIGAILSPASAQAPPAVNAGPAPIKLEFEKDPELGPGAVAVAHGMASAEPSRFWVNGLGINQPVAVAVAADPGVALNVSLHKFSWDEALRTGTTSGPKGTVAFQLRTQGEVGVKVTAPDGAAAPFTVTIWAGDEVLPRTVDLLRPVADYANATVERLGELPGGGAQAAPAAPPAAAQPAPPALPAAATPPWLLWGGVGGGALSLLVLGVLAGRLIGRKGGNRS
jgi:hypothetical protein